MNVATDTSPSARAARTQRNLPPGPRGILSRSNPFLSKDWLAAFAQCARDYGDIVFYRLLHVPMCLIFHPDDIESVLVTHDANFTKSRDYRALGKLLGNGLLTNEGASWLAQRKLIQPAFRHENILRYAGIITDFAARELSAWRDGEARDIHCDMMRLTLRIVAQALFGADVASDASDVSVALADAMEEFPSVATWAFLLPRSVPVPATRRMNRAIRRLDTIIYAIIRQRRASRSAAEPLDLLAVLLSAHAEDGRQMNDRQLRDEIMTLFLAGHETTANALSWTFYLLAQNPRAEAALAAELQNVLQGRAPAVSDLPRLPYTEMVVKESMRLYPPAWGVGRRAKKSFAIHGYHLPAGTNVFAFQWVTHRDPRFFPQPEQFQPERWRDDPIRNGRLPRFAYFPFGGGPRVCIGAGFAMMEAALLLATVAQRFHFDLLPDPPVEPLPSVTLRPKHGIPATLHFR